MATGNSELPELWPVDGLRIGSCAAGVRYPNRRDLVIFELQAGATAAAVFTRNAFCAAPVVVAKENLASSDPTYLLINTGNANAGTGEAGMRAAQACCEALAVAVEPAIDASKVLPFSTGVIAEPLPVQRIVDGIPAALADLDANGWAHAAEGIMTTDTRPKGGSLRYRGPEGHFTLTGIAKGAGMIRPDMATMLAYIATDLTMDKPLLQQALTQAVDASFNRITIDGDMSTNDSCVLMATGAADNGPLQSDSPLYRVFCEQLQVLAVALAQAIVRDGEGATRFVEIRVDEGRSEAECRQVAYAVAHSPLVKTALYAGDPNWGRILAAVGYAGLENLDVSQVRLQVGDVPLASGGAVVDGYDEAAASRVMAEEDLVLSIQLGRGAATTVVWTTDLSHDYVTINADYRS